MQGLVLEKYSSSDSRYSYLSCCVNGMWYRDISVLNAQAAQVNSVGAACISVSACYELWIRMQRTRLDARKMQESVAKMSYLTPVLNFCAPLFL